MHAEHNLGWYSLIIQKSKRECLNVTITERKYDADTFHHKISRPSRDSKERFPLSQLVLGHKQSHQTGNLIRRTIIITKLLERHVGRSQPKTSAKMEWCMALNRDYTDTEAEYPSTVTNLKGRKSLTMLQTRWAQNGHREREEAATGRPGCPREDKRRSTQDEVETEPATLFN